MLNFKKIKNIFISALLLLAFGISDRAVAADLDIFDVVLDEVAPNVLIVLDLSGSMGFVDVEVDPGVFRSRIDVARDALVEIVEDFPNLRWGLLTFPAGVDDEGGKLVEECKLRDETELAAFLHMIKNLEAVGGTPVASALAEAGLYFAGKRSFFHDGVIYTSPIENVCQYNYVILITDGYSSYDHGLKGGFWGTVPDRYEMYTSDSIFLREYMDGRRIGDYITDNGLGYKIAGPEFIYETYYTPDKNSDVQGIFTPTESGMDFYDWSKLEAGNPLRANGQLMIADIEALIAANKPYIYGYNAEDPSRPIPPMPAISLNSINSNGRSYLWLTDQGYLQHTQIYWGNIWGEGAGHFSSDYLDDVAAFLFNEDLRPDLGETGSKYEKQNVKTYTIGFMFGNELLKRTAIQGGTGAEGYMMAGNSDELTLALGSILSGIKEDMAVFAAPAVPTANENDVYAGDSLYMGLFKPQEGAWLGNVKRYLLVDNQMKYYLDNEGLIRDDAKSAWGNVVDGGDVSKGGAAAMLEPVLTALATAPGSTKTLRNIFTYIHANGTDEVYHDDNLFLEENAKLTASLLNVAEENRLSTIKTARSAPFGAVMHSTPLVVRYDDRSTVFAGASDGFLHAMDDADGSELWAFVMPEHLATIQYAATKNPGDGVWFLDGALATRTVNGKKALLFGSRRGGTSYMALDVSTYDKPKFLYQIPTLETDAASVGEWSVYNLGLAFSVPKFVKFNGNEIILLAGGYDVRYDTHHPNELTAVAGAAVIGVDSATGSPNTAFNKLSAQNSSFFKHSIIEMAAYDINQSGSVDTLYFGDLGSNLFYANSGSTNEFEPFWLFEDDNTSGRKFWYAPDIIKVANSKEYVYFGSGDRESPLDKLIQNRFYCVQNDPQAIRETSYSGAYLNLADLYDTTANLFDNGSEAEQQQAQTELDARDGWYINLREGEKVVSSPAIWQGIIMFTTYQPIYTDELPDPADICVSGSSSGIARLYALNYLNGSAGLDLDGDDIKDVSKEIGDTIPSGVTISVFEDGDVTYTVLVGRKGRLGVEEGFLPKNRNFGDHNVIYWREMF